jgi:hypothetical protein
MKHLDRKTSRKSIERYQERANDISINYNLDKFKVTIFNQKSKVKNQNQNSKSKIVNLQFNITKSL